MPAMHQYQAGAYQDEDKTTWGVFPAHISALAGGDGASIHSTSELAQCRMPGSIKLIPPQFNNHDGAGGTNVGHYRFGLGATEGFYEDKGAVVDGYVYTVLQSTEKTDQGKHLRQMYVTVIASPVNPSSGMRAFGFTINPSIYDHLVAMTSSENRTFQVMKDAQYYPDEGMFKNPVGPEKEADLGWGHGPKATYIKR